MTTSALRPQLHTALMRELGKTPKHKKNLIQQGFTLVELMIVIVIVGILSAVALPNFLSQSNKARATEAKTQLSSVLKQAGILYVEDGGVLASTCASIGTAISTANTAVTGKYTLAATPACAAGASSLTVVATGTTTNYPNVTGTITFASGVITLQ